MKKDTISKCSTDCCTNAQRKTQRSQSLLYMHRRVLGRDWDLWVFRWAFLQQSLERLLFSSFFNSVCFATLSHREFQGLSCNHYLCCYLPFVIPVPGTQIWLQHLILSSQLQIQHSIRHRAPVLPGLPPSLQVRLLFPRLFQLTAHLVVLQLSLLFLPHPLQTCL